MIFFNIMFNIMSATYFMGISVIILPLCHITALLTFPKHLILWKVVAKKLKKSNKSHNCKTN